MNCRICGSADTAKMGEVEYYTDFVRNVFECRDCRCRFTTHDDCVHDYLHSNPGSSYGMYREMQDHCKQLFNKRDVAGLKQALCRTPKYQFVIRAVEQRPTNSRLLEIGCSQGYLTAYFHAAGYKVTGADVSARAVADATAVFGDLFVAADSPVVEAGVPYDVIFHVGTVGCVRDPLAFTRRLLNLLKPGGQLLFNVPNADACLLPGQLWIDASPPPDVVTLFRCGFWKRFFGDAAEVTERVEWLPADRAFALGVRKLFGRRWRAPVPQPLETSLDDFKRSRPEKGRLWSIFERAVVKAGRLTRTLQLFPSQPSPFGLFVTMTKK